ncbi:MAG: molybdopterin-dependent oxidoreductase [Candidatus Bathyarchaeia archaeon]
MPEEKKAESTAEISRRSVLKWTAGLVVAGAMGAGLGFGADELLRSTAPPAGTATQTATGRVTATTGPPSEEKVFLNLWKESGALQVYVRDNRITRMEPFKGYPTYVNRLAERYRVYSPQRIQYPMKRVGWEPGGKSPIANRGKGDFVRITWDEAFVSITKELKRLLDTYGPSAFLYAPGEHSDSWYYHNRYLYVHDFLSFLGGYTSLGCDGLSWAGNRSSGASIIGDTAPNFFATEEISFFLKYSGMMVIWSRDPIVNDQQYEIIDDVKLMKEAGITLVFIGGGMDETAKNFADAWVPCHPYGDEALAAAITYTWITEGTYDQKYLDTHAVGFDEEHLPKDAPKGSSFKNYILGKSDGVPKTPEWAEPICGVKPRIIRALAREWASKPTGLVYWRGGRVNGGQYVRFMFTLLAMQGMGKPGIGLYGTRNGEAGARVWRDGVKAYPAPFEWGEARFTYHDTPAIPFVPDVYPFYHVIPPELADRKAASMGLAFAGKWPGFAIARVENPVKQVIRDVLWEVSMKADHEHPVYHRYNIGMDSVLYEYPMEGHSEAHAYFIAGGNYLARSPNCNSVMRALLSPKFEFILALDPWLEPDCMFADIVLPTVTNFERNDISAWGLYEIYCSKCIPNLFESRSDRDVWAELSKRMGIYDKWSAGMDTEDAWLKFIYEKSTSLPKHMTWEEFKKKGYHEWKVPDDWHPRTPNDWTWKKFWKDPKSSPLLTESGLIEIYSPSAVRIASLGQSGYYVHEDPNAVRPETQKFEEPSPGPDPLCPGIPAYIPNPEGKGTAAGEKYPIAVMTCHPKYAYHTSYQNVIWLQDEERKEINGYRYAPIWMSAKDAEARGIRHGDIVRVFNDRGQILCWADVSERILPGVARVNYGRWNDYVEPAVPGSLDKSGNIENLCRGGFISPFDTQQDVQAVAQVEKWKG